MRKSQAGAERANEHIFVAAVQMQCSIGPFPQSFMYYKTKKEEKSLLLAL